jgi:hypothetical protein
VMAGADASSSNCFWRSEEDDGEGFALDAGVSQLTFTHGSIAVVAYKGGMYIWKDRVTATPLAQRNHECTVFSSVFDPVGLLAFLTLF